MRFTVVYLILLLLSLLAFQNAHAYDKTLFEYYGTDHNEAEFSIIGYVIVDQKNIPTKNQVDPLIRKQMRYMLGLMRSRSIQAAALYPKWTFKILEVSKDSGGSYAVKYELKSKGVFATGTTQYTFTIPYNPKKIFSQSMGKCRDEKTDEAGFWYQWEPLKGNCPLVENKHYFNVTTKISPLKNTEITYPEYTKLVDINKTIKMTMFFGFDQHGITNWNLDNNKQDYWGIRSYKQQMTALNNLGFSETTWSRQQIETLYKAKDKYAPIIKEYNLSGKTANIRIRLVLLDTDLYHNSTAFHTLLKEALENESIIVYSGHSGLGKSLNLEEIEKLRKFKFKFNPNYQILFLGSCVPYSYYTELFFNRKISKTDTKGSLNLDIMSYGKESLFASKEDQYLTQSLVKFAQNSEKKSYQDIIKSSPNYFFGVNGDEDNPGN